MLYVIYFKLEVERATARSSSEIWKLSSARLARAREIRTLPRLGSLELVILSY